ncbi:hypothetical protein ACLK2I_09770 [Escherichia coli]
MNCWEILALQPGAEERDIKRRYAQLVKNCRPEDDPAAWQQLHDAWMNRLYVMTNEDQWQEEEEEQPIKYVQGYCSSSSCDDISRTQHLFWSSTS